MKKLLKTLIAVILSAVTSIAVFAFAGCNDGGEGGKPDNGEDVENSANGENTENSGNNENTDNGEDDENSDNTDNGEEDGVKEIVTTVTSEEWVTALTAAANSESFTAVMQSGGAGWTSLIYKVDKQNLSVGYSNEKNEVYGAEFLVKDGNVYYEYTEYNLSSETVLVKKTESTEDLHNMNLNDVYGLLDCVNVICGSFSAFTYNENEKVYAASGMEIKPFGLCNVNVKFSDGKIELIDIAGAAALSGFGSTAVEAPVKEYENSETVWDGLMTSVSVSGTDGTLLYILADSEWENFCFSKIDGDGFFYFVNINEIAGCSYIEYKFDGDKLVGAEYCIDGNYKSFEFTDYVTA